MNDAVETRTLTVASRFRGPPTSGNGGYVAGLLAGELGVTTAEVTLRAPVPLDEPLAVTRITPDALEVHRDGVLVAEARATSLDLDIPEPPSFDAALAARDGSPSLKPKSCRNCRVNAAITRSVFCCGDVPPGTGARVFAAPVAGFDGVAAAWEPHEDLATADGSIPAPVLWAALDCPGQFAWFAAGIRTGMLGRLTGSVSGAVSPGERCVVTGWCIEVERKKHFAGTALFGADGRLVGAAKAIWIGVRET